MCKVAEQIRAEVLRDSSNPDSKSAKGLKMPDELMQSHIPCSSRLCQGSSNNQEGIFRLSSALHRQILVGEANVEVPEVVWDGRYQGHGALR